MAAARCVLDAVAQRLKFSISYDEIPCGGRYYLQHGRDWPRDAEARCDAADAILLGAVGWPSPNGRGPVTRADGKMAGYSAVLGNRNRLDLYANIRPIRLFPGVSHHLAGDRRQLWRPADVDLVFVRENTEGLYVGASGRLDPGGVARVATDTRIITRDASERVCRCAFELADKRGSGSVTAVAKHNVLEGCRLFTEVFHEVSAAWPGVEARVAIVDAFAPALLVAPEKYGVVVTTNLFGDILTDLAALLQGGMGMAVGCNVGDEHAMFEPIHGSAPDIAGTHRANPMAMILAAAEAFRWLGERRAQSELQEAARRVEAAVAAVLARGTPLTADLVGSDGAPTSAVTRAVVEAIESGVGRA